MRPATIHCWPLLAAGLAFALPPDPVEWLTRVDYELGELKADSALGTWLLAAGLPDTRDPLNFSLPQWKRARCTEARTLPRMGSLMERAIQLLCRGPIFTDRLQSEDVVVELEMRAAYRDAQLCDAAGACYHGEPDLAQLMRTSRDPAVLRWAWEGWRDLVAPIGRAFPTLVRLQNTAASLNGYKDLGECWREELEVEDLKEVARRLLAEVAPFHRLLHAFVRHRLRQYYGPELVTRDGLIPAHLLGNMWSQSWESLLDILLNTTLRLDQRIKKKYKSMREMAREAERYYVSIGLEPMTNKFWQNSIISKSNANITCHGTAANLFRSDDFRMLLCGSVNWEDFYVIHHEMGHIQYYMAYQRLPAFFKEAANSAFQEAIGDTVMLAVETPDHLKRLGIVEDHEDIEIPLLLYQALKKIPQIPFGYVVDNWRWDVFASKISKSDYNKAWWKARSELEGITPPRPRPRGSVDPMAKYHIPDNTPYIRYFFSEFIQFQLLEEICRMKNEMYRAENKEFHLCDIHGFEEAGKKLRLLMSHGSMYKWDKILEEFTGGRYNKMSAEPILNYFKPLIKWLQEKITLENIPVGW